MNTVSTNTDRQPNEVLLALRSVVRAQHKESRWGYGYFHFHTTGQGDDRKCFASYRADVKGVRQEVEGIPAQICWGKKDLVEISRDGHHSYELGETNRYAPRKGSEHVLIEVILSAIADLPSDAHFELHMNLDNKSNGYAAEAKLHGDAMYLKASWVRGRTKHERCYLLDVSICAHNSARFGFTG